MDLKPFALMVKCFVALAFDFSKHQILVNTYMCLKVCKVM